MQLTTSKTRRLSATLTVAVGGALTLAGAHAAVDTARRCAPHTNERIVARGPSTLLLLRTVQETDTTLGPAARVGDRFGLFRQAARRAA